MLFLNIFASNKQHLKANAVCDSNVQQYIISGKCVVVIFAFVCKQMSSSVTKYSLIAQDDQNHLKIGLWHLMLHFYFSLYAVTVRQLKHVIWHMFGWMNGPTCCGGTVY